MAPKQNNNMANLIMLLDYNPSLKQISQCDQFSWMKMSISRFKTSFIIA